MIWKFCLALLLLASADARADDSGQSRAVAAGRALLGQPAPAASLRMLEGQPLDLGALYGKKPVYLKFWATWCVPCREQMPGFESDFEAMGDKIAFVAVDVGISETEARIRAYRQDHGLKMPIAIDDGSLASALNLRVTPEHIVIGRDGRILYIGHLADDKLHQALAQAVGESEDKRLRAVLFFSPGCESYLGLSQPDTAADCKRFREQITPLLDRQDVRWEGIAMGLWTLPEDVTRWEAKVGFPLPAAVDTDGSLFHRFGVRQIPAVALIDPEDKLVCMIGPEETDLAAAITAGAAGTCRKAGRR